MALPLDESEEATPDETGAIPEEYIPPEEPLDESDEQALAESTDSEDTTAEDEGLDPQEVVSSIRGRNFANDVTPRRGISPEIVAGVKRVESNNNPNATGPMTRYGTAKGQMQLIDATGEEMFRRSGLPGKYDPYNAKQNETLGTNLLNDLKDKYGDDRLALAAYNYNPKGVDNLLKKYGSSYEDIESHLPGETYKYVKNVLNGKGSTAKTASVGKGETQSNTAPIEEPSTEALPKIDVASASPDTKGLAGSLLTLTSSPAFEALTLAEKAKAIKDVAYAKYWGPDQDKIVQTVMTNYIDAAPEDEQLNYSDIIGKAPFIEPGQPIDKVLNSWKEDQVQKLIQDGINPAFLGDQLFHSLDSAIENEKSAFTARNRGTLGWIANRGGNLARDVVKGIAAGVTKPVGGITRLLGGEELGNKIADLPEYLGKPANDYLYKTDDQGYLKLNPDNTPITHWQSDAAQMVGQVGSFLAGGFALKAAGFGAAAIKGGLFAANTLTIANDSFRSVYEETNGDLGKSYLAAMFSLPAAYVGTLGEAAVIAKWANPAISALSPFNRAKYLANVVARNAAVGGVTNAGLDATSQVGEMIATGRPYDSGRTYVALGSGGAISGLIGGVAALGDRPPSTSSTNGKPPTPPNNPPTTPGGTAELHLKDIIPPGQEDAALAVIQHQGTIPEQQRMIKELEKFQRNDAQELILGTDDAKKIPANMLDLYAVDVASDGDKTVLTKKSTYQPVESEELSQIDGLIGKLNKSLETDSSPNSIEALGQRKAKLQRQLAEQTESVNRSTVEMTRQRGALEKEVTAKRALLDEQTDPILKKVVYSELKDSEANLETFDKANEPVMRLHEKIGGIQDSLDEVNLQLKNASKDTYVNDIKAKEANLKGLLKKRTILARELKQKALDEKAAQVKTLEGVAPKKKEISIPGIRETTPLDKIAADIKEEVHQSEGVKVGDKYILPVGQKWFVLNGKGDLLGKGHDYYADASKTAQTNVSQRIPGQEASPPKENVQAVPVQESTAGAQFAGPIKERATGERLRLSPRLSETVRAGFSGNNELTYFTQSHGKTSALARNFIEEHGGFENAVKELLARPDEYVSAENTASTQYVIEELNAAEARAVEKGDKAAADSYAALQVELGDKRSRSLTSGGQGIEAAKLWADFDPSTFIRGTKKSLRDGALEKYANKKGISAEELRAKEGRLTRTKADIEKENSRPESADKTKRLKKLKSQEEDILQDLTDLKRGQDEAEAKLTEEDQANIKKLFATSRKQGGFLQQNTLAEAFRIRDAALKKVGVNRADTWFSFWQANQLSDLSTQVVNIVGNTTALMGSAASYFATGLPRGKLDGFAMLQGFVNGALKQGFDAAMLELQGIKTYRPTADKFERGATGQSRKDFMKTAPVWMQKTGLNNIGIVFRALSAADAFFFKTAQEGMAKFAAYNEGQALGLKGEALQKHVADTLYNASEHFDAAYAQAKEEVAAGKEAGLPASDRLARERAWEILERKRPDSIRTESLNFASKNTFSNKPEGLVGTAVESLQKLAHFNLEIGDKSIQPLKYFFPFLNVAGNILNSSLDYTIIGGLRAAGLNKNLSALERRNTLGKFMIGSVLSGTVYGAAREFLDDKDPYFAIYGEGPTDYNKNAQWKAQGGRPYSVKLGDQYFRYLETPLGTLLGGLGAVMDEMRYNKQFDKASSIEALGIVIGGAGKSFVSNSFLRSIGGFVNAIQGKNAEGQKSKTALIDVLAVNPVKGFVPGAGFGRMISKLAEDPIDTKQSFYAKMVSGIPFVQELGTRPALNAFGEPVERTWEDRISAVGRFYSDRVEDPAWRFLAGSGYTIPDFGVTVASSNKNKAERAATIGAGFADVLTPDERYELISRAGPKVKDIVQKYAERYKDLPYSEKVQGRLNEEIKALRNSIKRKIILGN